MSVQLILERGLHRETVGKMGGSKNMQEPQAHKGGLKCMSALVSGLGGGAV